jgi:hypothetical protein
MVNTRLRVVAQILLLALLPVVLFVSSCDFNKTESEKGFENPLAHVGTMHNQGLDHVLGDIKETEIKERDLLKKQGRNVLSDVIETSARTFLEERGLGAESIKASKIGMSVVRSGRGTELRKNNVEGILRFLPDSLRGDLGEKQKEYLRQVGDVLLNEPPTSKLKKRLNELGRSARDELSEEDRRPVFAATAVAKGSYKYWKEHLDEWKQAIFDALPEPDSTVMRNSKGEMAKTNCPCKKLVEQRVVRTDDGDTITVYVYECGCNGGGGGEGFLGSAADVGTADVGGAVGGAIAGSIIPDPATTATGAGTAAIVASAGQAACEVREAIGWGSCS